MTATAEITTISRTGVLLVPNAALRFTPPVATAAAAPRGIVSSLLPRPPGPRPQNGNGKNGKNGKGASQKVHVLRDGVPVAVPVTVGASDGRQTEVTGGALQPGMEVVTESKAGRS